MIVCICNNVSDKAIRHAVHAGVTSLTGLRTQLEVGACCGKCIDCAKTLLRECLEDQSTQTENLQRTLATA
jgi:bacterioferritin-associated ferredoxin